MKKLLLEYCEVHYRYTPFRMHWADRIYEPEEIQILDIKGKTDLSTEEIEVLIREQENLL